MLMQTSLKRFFCFLFLSGLIACDHTCEAPRFHPALFSDPESRDVKWDYDEITHRLIVHYHPQTGGELFKLKDDGIKVKSIITSVIRCI
jgi:hypothetical protein